MQMREQITIEDLPIDQLEALRCQLELPQVKLCAECDINPSTYQRWLKFVRGKPGGTKPQPRSLRAVREVLKSHLSRRRAS